MIVYPKPSPTDLRTVFADFHVDLITHPKANRGRDAWAYGLRAATVHHTAGKNSADYLASFNYGGANVVINNGRYNGAANDGRAVILCWGSAWHSGAGGPWPGVAGKDSLHLVSWGIEIESLGTKRDITEAQVVTVGKMLAALVELGMPIGNVHRHADWTDGTGPVGGHPLPTNGRKIDTRKDLGYTTEFWVAQARAYRKTYWDGQVPSYDAIIKAQDGLLKSPAAYRLACRLADLLNSHEPRPNGEQGYPKKAMQDWQTSRGYVATGTYGPKAHALIWPG